MRVKRKSNKPTTYVPVSERGLPEAEQFSVQIRRMDFLDKAKVRDKMVEFNDEGGLENIRMFSIGVEVAADLLDGWSNLVDDETGADIVFDARNRHKMFDLLPEEIQEELGQVFASGSLNSKAEQRIVDEAAKEKEAEDEDVDEDVDDTPDEAETATEEATA